RIFARALAWPLDFAGLWPFRPRPNPVRALSPSIYPDAAGAAPDLQKIVGQAYQLPLGRHFLQASQQKLADPSRGLDHAEYRATASKIPVILAVLDGNLVCSYNVYYWHFFNNHPNYGCKSLEYSQNFRSITVSGLPYLMKNPHFDAVALMPNTGSTMCLRAA